MSAGVLSRRALSQDPVTLAQLLIGCTLVRTLDDGVRLSGRIVETEAYLGVKDRAAHSFGGHRSQRVEAMYARGGTAYVYFTYGMHHCMNVVCGAPDEPVAVLIRALEPIDGIDHMRAARQAKCKSTLRETDLCSGPARLCQALRIDRSLNFCDLATSPQLAVLERPPGAEPVLSQARRIGIASAGSWANRRLRWFESQNPHVSDSRIP